MDLPTFATYQAYPKGDNALAHNLDTSLDQLWQRLRDELANKVYAYVMTSVETHEAVFYQRGCGPNFQGDLLTLCSCMNQMRALEGIEPGIWISGFTDVHATTKGNGLFYLTKIADTAVSQYQLWKKLPPEVRIEKAAHLSMFGDVFEPVVELERPDDPVAFSFSSYRPPISGHVHAKPTNPNRWHKDIDYVHWNSKRRQRFIIGDPDKTFIWTRPLICFRQPPHPRYKCREIQEFLDLLTT